jgi:hypothetical protein
MAGRLMAAAIVLAGAAIVVPGAAEAQMLGVGPRFSLVRGDLATNTPSTRFVGGSARLGLSKNVGLEGSLDMRTTWDTGHTQRLRETPMQASLLIYPIRSILSPYALGGFGIYNRNYEVLGPDAKLSLASQERKSGMHLGFGGELRVGRHAVAYVDYRYRFVKFGEEDSTSEGDVATQGLLAAVPGLSLLKFSHQGSMWTGGVGFVF